MYRRFGAEVTVVEKAPRLIAREDDDVSDEVPKILEPEGIAVRTSADVHRLAPHEPWRGGVAWTAREGHRTPSGRTSCSRSAAARTPTISVSTRPASPDARATSPSTRISTTNARGFGRSATATAAAPSRTRPTTTSRSSPPTCSTAIIARLPRTRARVRALHRSPAWPRRRHGSPGARDPAAVLIGTRPMSRVARAIEKGETLGFMKVVVDAATREFSARRSSAPAATRPSTACST